MRAPALLCTVLLLLAEGSGLAAGRRPYGGAMSIPAPRAAASADPRAARTPGEQLVASLLHCRLFGQRPDGHVVAQLARDEGSWRRGVLELELVDGATFHDGAPVGAADVAASLSALARAARPAGMRAVWRLLRFEATGPRTLRVHAPKKARAAAIRRLLARPEAAVLRGGETGPGRGCGAWRLRDANEGLLEPFEGHPDGRPWLGTLRLRDEAGPDAEVRGLVFGELDLATVPSPRYRNVREVDAAGHGTVLAIPGPRLSGASGLAARATIAELARRARLPRHVDWPSEIPEGLWPSALSPTGAGAARRMIEPISLERCVIAYPAGDASLEELARALRDGLGSICDNKARALPVAGLRSSARPGSGDQGWDLALLAHPWSATGPEQAALELAAFFGLPGLDPSAVLALDVRGWAREAEAQLPLIPILHYHRPLHVRRGFRVAPRAAGLPDLSRSWID